jgi:hypothetical protein
MSPTLESQVNQQGDQPKLRSFLTNLGIGKTETIAAIVERVNGMSQANDDKSTPEEATVVVPAKALEHTQIQGIVGRLMKTKQSVCRQCGKDLGHSLVVFEG